MAKVIACIVSVSAALAWAPAPAAELPEATKKMLAELKLDSSILDGTEAEYEVPAAWIEGSKKEGTLRVIGTWDLKQTAQVAAIFKERYPWINIKFDFGTRETRSVKPLITYKEGRLISDIIDGMGAVYFEYLKADALMSFADLPNLKVLAPEIRVANDNLVPHILIYWCMSYNENKVQKAELPQTWEDLLNAERWGNKRIGIGNRPNLWFLQLWAAKGEAWGQNYIHRLFREVQPQLRKEGMDALISLVALGEFDMAIPSADYRTSQADAKGAPVGWHCPAPVPTTFQALIAFKNNPNPNSARIYVNWLLSKEGQIAQNYATNASSVRDDLQIKELLPYAEQLAGRKRAFRDFNMLETTWPGVSDAWNKEWQAVR